MNLLFQSNGKKVEQMGTKIATDVDVSAALTTENEITVQLMSLQLRCRHHRDGVSHR